MKTKILSLSIFLFLILVGFLSAHSGKIFNQNSIAQKANSQFSKFLLPSQNQEISILKKHDLSSENNIISLENDDDDLIFIKKTVPKSYLTSFSIPSFLISSLLLFKNELPLCNHFSYTASHTYLFQKVLKILYFNRILYQSLKNRNLTFLIL